MGSLGKNACETGNVDIGGKEVVLWIFGEGARSVVGIGSVMMESRV